MIPQLDKYFKLSRFYFEKTNGQADDFKDYLAMYIHNSTAIEGNTLTFEETKYFLESGITIPYKRIDEHNEILDLKDAYFLMLDFIQHQEPLDINSILQLHYEATKRTHPEEAGKFKKYSNRNDTFVYPSPMQSKILMTEFATRYQDVYIHQDAFLRACHTHYDIASIHPFQDNNGRVSRLLFEWVLKKERHFSKCFFKHNRTEYINSLKNSQMHNNFNQFLNYCIERCIQELEHEIKILNLNENSIF